MIAKPIPKILTAGAIAIGIAALDATVTFSQTVSQEQAPQESKVTFICDANNSPPTTFAIGRDERGNPTLTPIFSWHSEYLFSGDSAKALCQQMAQKLQSKYDRGEQPYFSSKRTELKDETTGKVNYRMDVCLVASESADCENSSQREDLFSLNGSYKDPLACVMDRTQPKACRRYIPTRGPLISIPSGNYKRGWLSWFY
ncbi:MAG: hypothetical protein IGR93_11370 [Hydrococcus sp. C42_A2020_068]|uniref:COP23 domain-containing protein n=1 Tax=Pleurocapsa sp. PCC 7327 TaxID=118163 RepID=UPI00029FDBBD|nr:COP23 domain-containing protein [Pleurocapsa sp. PCC 7327]AFY79351.1 hypothetical protein Ple7327_4222 [Pleurocapsa sp. PCC 7327]MBF2020674.1 hypothetical protein [Hydrococcus sp. C42_A2020_068]